MAPSSGRQPNFAALNRGRHLYSAGRPSGWALAHISSIVFCILLLKYRKYNSMYFDQSILNTLTTKYFKYYFKCMLRQHFEKYFKYIVQSIFPITES